MSNAEIAADVAVASTPLERIAKGLMDLLRVADVSPAEFTALMAEFDNPDPQRLGRELGDNTLDEDAVILATGILAAWHQDPRYVDEVGDPLPLALDGEPHSVRGLFDQVTGAAQRVSDQVVTDIVERLIAHESLQRLPDGNYIARKRTFKVNAKGPAMNAVFARLASFIETVAFNATHGGRFERTAKVKGFPSVAVPLLMATLEESGMQFLHQIDIILEEQREQASPADPVPTKEIGVGVYLLERDDPAL
jgi:hypothetical protein